MSESSIEAGAEEVIRKVYVANVRPGEEVRTVFRLLKKAVQTSRAGKRFVVLELVDKTGILQGRIFENIDAADSAIANGDYLLVSGTVSKFRGLPQLIVSSVDRLDPEPIDPAEFAYTPPTSPPPAAATSNGASAQLPPNLAHWLKHREVAKALDALLVAIEHVARQPRVEKKRPSSLPPVARNSSLPPAAPAFKPFQELVQTTHEHSSAEAPTEPAPAEHQSAPEASGENPSPEEGS